MNDDTLVCDLKFHSTGFASLSMETSNVSIKAIALNKQLISVVISSKRKKLAPNEKKDSSSKPSKGTSRGTLGLLHVQM